MSDFIAISPVLNENREMIFDEENRALYAMEIDGNQCMFYLSPEEVEYQGMKDNETRSLEEGSSKGREEVVEQNESLRTKAVHQKSRIAGSSAGPEEEKAPLAGPEVVSRKSGQWTHNEIIAIIDAYEEVAETCKDSLSQGFWKQVSGYLSTKIFKKTWIECREKWKSLERTYKSNLLKKQSTGEGPITWIYFERMHEVMGKKPQIQPVSIASSIAGYKKRIFKETNTNKTSTEQQVEEEKPKKPKKMTKQPEWLIELREEVAVRHEENKADRKSMIEICKQFLEIEKKKNDSM